MAITIVRPVKGDGKCGFCRTGHHTRCVVGLRNALPRADYPKGSIYLCLCDEGGCDTGRRKCTYCNNRVTEEVNPNTWECFDREACRDSVEAKREANPLYVQLRESKERAAMAKIEENKDKAEKRTAKAKTGTCVCGCKGTTKGGKFLPGHDARFVSTLVGKVEEANFTKKAEGEARAALKSAEASEKLVAKFDKSLGLATERVEKKAAAAKEKEAAKVAAAKEKAAAAS